MTVLYVCKEICIGANILVSYRMKFRIYRFGILGFGRHVYAQRGSQITLSLEKQVPHSTT